MTNGLSQKKPSQAKAGWRKWCGFGGAALCLEQSLLPDAIKPRCTPAVRYCHAIQHLQQRNASGFISIHEREEGLDFCLGIGQGQKRIAGSRTYLHDGARVAAKQGFLVWLNLAGARSNRRFGNLGASMAERGLCTMGTSEAKAEATTTATRDQGKALPKYAEEKRIALSVGQTSQAFNKSVHGTRGVERMSVQRIYVGRFCTSPCPYTGYLLVIPLLLSIYGAKEADMAMTKIYARAHESTPLAVVAE